MKIKKQLVESALVEEDEIPSSTDPVKDVADDIQDVAGDAITDQEAEVMASEAKEVGQAMGGAEIIPDTPAIAQAKDVDADLGIENELTKFLQENLEDALENLEMGSGTNANNIIIVGLPGSGKTASFMDWARHATPKVNVTYVNAKNNDLEAFINGYTVRIPGEGDDKVGSVRQAYGSNLDGLDRPNSILFLDEFNRQTKDQIRASLLTLINEHYVMGKDEVRGLKGVRHFPNLLFTVACCNPTTGADKGAGRLNSAETTRFGVEYFYDSKPAETIAYLEKSYKKRIAQLDKNNPKFEKFLLILLKTLDLGMYIVKSEDFRYDNKNDVMAVDDLQKTDRGGREGQLWNQRLFTLGLQRCKGDVQKFKDWYHNHVVILKKDIDMLDEILRYYETPSDYELAHTWYPEYETLFKNETAPVSSEEDDPELFDSDLGQEADTEMSDDDALAAIQSEMSGWKKP